MKEIILLKGGEFVLKGLNRRAFEDILLKNIRWRLRPVGNFSVRSAQSTIFVEPKTDHEDMDGAMDTLSRVFGIVGLSRAAVCEKDIDIMKDLALSSCLDDVKAAKSFKVIAKRSDKAFPLPSPKIAEEIGGVLYEASGTPVDLYNPDLTVYAEVRDFGAYIHAGKQPGAGGMPLGTSGKGTILLSGGIDSPVAGYMMAKRGMILNGVHFHSYPYTSLQARDKVFELARLMCRYVGRMDLHVVSFTEIQSQIRAHCQEDYYTIIMRRFMMKIASRIAESTDSLALITGESLAQVASQTAMALAVTDDAATLPVFRPLIGMDKEEIVTIARKIDTFETSILPYEDCCTVFTPKHPITKPKLDRVLEAMGDIDEQRLIEEAVASVELVKISQNGVKNPVREG